MDIKIPWQRYENTAACSIKISKQGYETLRAFRNA